MFFATPSGLCPELPDYVNYQQRIPGIANVVSFGKRIIFAAVFIGM